MNEYILKQDAIDTIMGQPPDAHYPSWYAAQIEELSPADVVPVNREKLMAVLRDYFSIGDSYTYELTRVKSAFEVGIISLDDFEEWGEDNISDLCDYIFRELRKGNKDG